MGIIEENDKYYSNLARGFSKRMLDLGKNPLFKQACADYKNNCVDYNMYKAVYQKVANLPAYYDDKQTIYIDKDYDINKIIPLTENFIILLMV